MRYPMFGETLYEAHLRRCLQLTVKPAVCSARFHRVSQVDDNLMDVIASGALKGADTKARGAGCDPRQRRGCLTRWTWPGMLDHDARL